jgi:hypothetical protein
VQVLAERVDFCFGGEGGVSVGVGTMVLGVGGDFGRRGEGILFCFGKK